jgi:GntR family transcriptional regulator
MDTLAEPELVIGGGKPVSQQVVEQLRWQILVGVLRPGEELPTVRSLAVDLAVNPHVVEEAYDCLAREGFLLRGDGCGPKVADPPPDVDRSHLIQRCREFLCRVAAEGYSAAEVMLALHACFDEGISHGQPS